MSKKGSISFCNRCYHTWHKRKKEGQPKRCPKCKSQYWDTPRKKLPKGFVLELSQVICDLHDAIIETSGGDFGIRDSGGVYHSTYAFLNHKNRNAGKPTKLGAFILNEFAKKHHFTDGNKRTAYVLCKQFMLISRCHLDVDYDEAVKFIIEIAKYDSRVTFEKIKEWLNENCIIIEDKDMRTYLNNVLVELIIGERKNGKK